MNKADLIAEVKNNLGDDSSKAAAERALDAVIEAIKSGVQGDGSVQLVGFGTFSVSTRAARKGVNPKTKETINIPESTTVKFKPGAALKALV